MSIRSAALTSFCRRGFHGATLDEIAGQVGLTRGALLHHFHSKAALLAAVVDPCLSAIDAVLDTAQVDDPPSDAQRRQLLRDLAELAWSNRAEVQLLVGDLATRGQLKGVEKRRERLIRLLAGSQAGVSTRVRATATLGALLHPAACAWLELESPEARSAWLDACFAAVGLTAGPTSPCLSGRGADDGAGFGPPYQAATG